METLERNEIRLEGTEFIGQRAGQQCYINEIRPNLKPCINVVIFPEETEELQYAFIRGILGYKDDDLLYDFRCENPAFKEKLKNAVHDLSCVHMDLPVPEQVTKKKKK